MQRQTIRQPTQPATAKLQQEEQQPGTQKKKSKTMGNTRRLEMFNLVLLLREKANDYRAGNISNYYEIWRSITSDKYILDVVENGLFLSFYKDQPS